MKRKEKEIEEIEDFEEIEEQSLLDFFDFLEVLDFLFRYNKTSPLLPMPSAIIFDFDGVLVDSERYWDDIDRTFFRELIPTWTTDDGDKLSGLGVKKAHEVLTRDYGLTLAFPEFFARLDTAVLKTIYGERTQLLPGAVEFLDLLTARNIPFGIASSSHRQWIDPTLKRLGIFDRFPVICTGDDVDDRTKPLPDVYLLAAKQLGVDPAKSMAIEDSKNGIRAAKAAGMTCIAIRTDMNVHQDLTEADAEVRSFDEMHRFIPMV